MMQVTSTYIRPMLRQQSVLLHLEALQALHDNMSPMSRVHSRAHRGPRAQNHWRLLLESV